MKLTHNEGQTTTITTVSELELLKQLELHELESVITHEESTHYEMDDFTTVITILIDLMTITLRPQICTS